jgi:hypothetical protein
VPAAYRSERMLRCRALGHRHRFVADGSVLRWHCDRCGASLGERRYPSAAAAERYAGALDRADRGSGRYAPPFALLPLRLARRLRRPTERG